MLMKKETQRRILGVGSLAITLFFLNFHSNFGWTSETKVLGIIPLKVLLFLISALITWYLIFNKESII